MSKKKYLGMYDLPGNKRFLIVPHGMSNLPYMVFFDNDLRGHKLAEWGVNELIKTTQARKRVYEITQTEYS